MTGLLSATGVRKQAWRLPRAGYAEQQMEQETQ
jgi:hypothetical protein